MSDIVHVDISNVARWWFFSDGMSAVEWPKGFASLASPWRDTEYHMNAPLCVSNPGDFWNIRLVASKSTDVTVSVQSFKFDTVNYIEPILDHMSIEKSELHDQESGWIQRILVRALIPLIEKGKPIDSRIIEIGGGCIVLNDQGEFVTDRYGVPPLFKGLEYIPNYHVYMLAAFFAISLLHCRNVEVRDRPVSRQQRRMAERTGKSITVYKELVIDAFRKQVRYESDQSGDNQIKRALHICRGHFATYTDANPLFGRVTGTFWKPMHVRGHKEAGQVHKTYSVKEPQ